MYICHCALERCVEVIDHMEHDRVQSLEWLLLVFDLPYVRNSLIQK